MHLLLPYSILAVFATVCAGLCFLLPETIDMPTLENIDSVNKDSASKTEDTENGNPLKVIPLKLFYYQTFFETWPG